jgi:6-phosphogluconolactonase (cycloisomerase 2 family)
MSPKSKALALVISASMSIVGYAASHPSIPRFAYVANNQDDSVSIFAIRKAGLRAAGYIYTGAASNPRAVSHRNADFAFSGVSTARGLCIDQSDDFLYAANNSGNSVSGFRLDRTSGNLQLLSDSPYPAGTNPTSITIVNNLQ